MTLLAIRTEAFHTAAPAVFSLRRPALPPHLLTRMLDLVDYPMLTMADDTCVLFANQMATVELEAGHPLGLQDRCLFARSVRDGQILRAAINAALQRGVQSMLALGESQDRRVSVAVVPLREPGEPPAALLLLGKQHVCEELSADAYARAHALTTAETRVLKKLCAGGKPGDIARALGVKLSTVRTQIGCIRAKTGARDIGGIVGQLASLPPLPCLMRRVA